MDLEALVTDELREEIRGLHARVVRGRGVLAAPAARDASAVTLPDGGEVDGLVHRRRPGRRGLPRDQRGDRHGRAAARVPRRRGHRRPGRARRGLGGARARRRHRRRPGRLDRHHRGGRPRLRARAVERGAAPLGRRPGGRPRRAERAPSRPSRMLDASSAQRPPARVPGGSRRRARASRAGSACVRATTTVPRCAPRAPQRRAARAGSRRSSRRARRIGAQRRAERRRRIGARHSTCVSRPAGAASMFVGLHTAPSTYSSLADPHRREDPRDRCTRPAPPRRRVAAGAPGAPNTTRRPRARSTQTTRRRPSKRSAVAGDARAAGRRASRPARRMRASAAARTSAPGARPSDSATARPGRCRPRSRARAEPAAHRPRTASVAVAVAVAARRPCEARCRVLVRRGGAARSGGPVRARLAPASRSPRRIEPAEVPTIVLARGEVDRRASLRSRRARPPIQAAPSVPPAPSTSTSGRCIADGMPWRVGRYACT